MITLTHVRDGLFTIPFFLTFGLILLIFDVAQRTSRHPSGCRKSTCRTFHARGILAILPRTGAVPQAHCLILDFTAPRRHLRGLPAWLNTSSSPALDSTT